MKPKVNELPKNCGVCPHSNNEFGLLCTLPFMPTKPDVLKAKYTKKRHEDCPLS